MWPVMIRIDTKSMVISLGSRRSGTSHARTYSGQIPSAIRCVKAVSMSRPTGRVLTLLELLQSGGVRTAAELADRLGVDGRTVRRYVDQLSELDIPVEAVRGRYGGYR